MRKVSIAKLNAVVGNRKPGYYEAVMAVARPHSETHIEIDVLDYDRIRREYAVTPPSGPGSRLKWLLSWLGIVATHGCSCNKMAKKMNEHGGLWCLLSGRAEILSTMRAEAEKRKLAWRPLGANVLIFASVLLWWAEKACFRDTGSLETKRN